jgi:DNA-binding transcriptional ArsR family regulator
MFASENYFNMATSSIKEQVYQELSRVTHAISNPKRMELIDVLSQKGYSVEELSKEIAMSIASTSQHLQVLKSVKLVETQRQGNFIIEACFSSKRNGVSQDCRNRKAYRRF